MFRTCLDVGIILFLSNGVLQKLCSSNLTVWLVLLQTKLDLALWCGFVIYFLIHLIYNFLEKSITVGVILGHLVLWCDFLQTKIIFFSCSFDLDHAREINHGSIFYYVDDWMRVFSASHG